MNQFIQSWLLQAFVIFLVVGSLAGMVVGALLVLRPQSLQRVNQLLGRWTSTRHLDQSLEGSVKFDPWFYRYRHICCTLTLLGAFYIIYFFTMSLDKAGTISAMTNNFQLPSSMVGALLDATVLSALLGALFAAFISVVLLLRPSMLREFEQGANQWLSLRRALKPAEIPRKGVDAYAFQYGVQAGTLLVLGSLYILVVLLSWVGH